MPPRRLKAATDFEELTARLEAAPFQTCVPGRVFQQPVSSQVLWKIVSNPSSNNSAGKILCYEIRKTGLYSLRGRSVYWTTWGALWLPASDRISKSFAETRSTRKLPSRSNG